MSGRDASTAQRKGRILVADDEPHIRRILTTLLESADYEVDPVSDGPTALEHLESEEDYDLVLLDIMMPGATGLEVLGQARSLGHRRDVPVLILTAKGQDADRDEAYSLGADDFVTKPFSPKKLLARIDEILDRDGGTRSDRGAPLDGGARPDGEARPDEETRPDEESRPDA